MPPCSHSRVHLPRREAQRPGWKTAALLVRGGPEAGEVDHDGFLAAAGDDHDRLLAAGALLAVRGVRGYENVVPGSGLQPDLFRVLGEHDDGMAGDHVG